MWRLMLQIFVLAPLVSSFLPQLAEQFSLPAPFYVAPTVTVDRSRAQLWSPGQLLRFSPPLPARTPRVALALGDKEGRGGGG